MADGKPIVYLDMDGVLADFFGGVEFLYGVEHWKELTNDKTKDLKKQVIDRITGTDFFAVLPKFPTADTLIDMVKKFTGGRFSINTSPLRGDHENSAKYKKVWISKDNILSLYNSLGENADVISLDLDGNDIYLVEKLLSNKVLPKLFIVEYNAKFPPQVEFEIDYNVSHKWQRNDYYC